MSPLLAEGITRTTFEWGRIQSNRDWILPIVACLAIMLLVRYLYRRDAEELPPTVGWLLTALRTIVFYGLLILYLQPQWRVEREVVRNSRVLLMADTSQSMRLTDVEDAGRKASRSDYLARLLEQSDFLDRLRKVHDVVALKFDRDLGRVAALGKQADQPGVKPDDPAPTTSDESKPVAWRSALAPVGLETRLGETLRQTLHDEQSSPLAGIIVISDGGQNAGVGVDPAIQAAQQLKTPIFTVGIGQERQPANVRVSNFTAPPRAYPGDRFSLTGYLQAQKMAGRSVTVRLLSRPAGKTNGSAPDKVEATRQVTLGGDGEVTTVPFDLSADATGLRTFTLQVQAPPDDHNPDDNRREADVEIVDRKNHILLIAGGPSREYHFLRSVLFRDKTITLDLLLQTAQEGMSQEAAQILDTFPVRPEEMYSYDALVAVDPDWQSLSADQVALLEKWVATQGGGMVVSAGPVCAGKSIGGWTQDPAMSAVRALYPVEFERSIAVMDASGYQAKEPWPLDFTREGLESEYLWLEDTALESQRTWASLAGVYSYFPVHGPKPGATVLARFSDPRTARSGQLPVFFATQFYGSGRVFYLGSAEMWRLRQIDEGLFERFYTKIIRYVSQGRLLRGSNRGMLLVSKDQGYLVGETVDLRAQLTNPKLEPLEAASVAAQVTEPGGAKKTITLRPDVARPGSFAGGFTAAAEGTYRIDLPIPDAKDQQLTQRVQVRLPDLELENPQRNDPLLSRIAKATGGRYYPSPSLAFADRGDGLAAQLKDRTKTSIFPAAPSRQWEETWLRWMMYALGGLLSLEWLIRRLYKLA